MNSFVQILIFIEFFSLVVKIPNCEELSIFTFNFIIFPSGIFKLCYVVNAHL